MLFFVATAFAAAPGHYHPEDIQVRSEVFMASAKRLQETFERRSRTLKTYARALNAYQEALDLLGERASEVERTRLDELQRAFARQGADLQLAADSLIEDFDTAMVGAMERASAPFGELQRCKATIPVPSEGPRIPGMAGKTKPNPECKGEDRNQAIATAMDHDEGLTSAIDAMMDREWPTVELPSAPQAPTPGDADEWVMARDLLTKVAGDGMKTIRRRDDERRDKIDAALESETEIDVEALRTEVRRIEQQTAKARASLAAPVLVAADERLAKKAKGVTVGWCANPRTLGGCTGEDTTSSRVSLLVGDKKFMKAVP